MSNCSKEMSFEECELTIIRNAVDEAEKRNSKEIINNPQINNIIKIVEEFLKNKKLICYGGTAINNILQKRLNFMIEAWNYLIMIFIHLTLYPTQKN